jgi:hypothetical protein
MAIPPIRSHGDSGHLQDHNDIKSTLDAHDGYLDQGVKTTDSPIFDGVRFGQTFHSSAVINITNNLKTTIDSFSASAYRSAEYNVQISQGTKYTNVKITVLHDNSSAGISEYGKVEMGGTIPYTLSADISGVNALFSCEITNGDTSSAQIKFFRTIINL